MLSSELKTGKIGEEYAISGQPSKMECNDIVPKIDKALSKLGSFTLHGSLDLPLERFSPEALTKITIPYPLIQEASLYLRLACINEFSVFPDLDGLARYLMEKARLV